jgi:hypothetical protein
MKHYGKTGLTLVCPAAQKGIVSKEPYRGQSATSGSAKYSRQLQNKVCFQIRNNI